MRAPKHCGRNGCLQLVTGKPYCPEHTGWKTSPRTASSKATGTRQWRLQRAKALQRDNHQCQTRGPRCTVIATEVDHIIPVSQGGSDDLTNCVSTCHPCHAQKTQREAQQGRDR